MSSDEPIINQAGSEYISLSQPLYRHIVNSALIPSFLIWSRRLQPSNLYKTSISLTVFAEYHYVRNVHISLVLIISNISVKYLNYLFFVLIRFKKIKFIRLCCIFNKFKIIVKREFNDTKSLSPIYSHDKEIEKFLFAFTFKCKVVKVETRKISEVH